MSLKRTLDQVDIIPSTDVVTKRIKEFKDVSYVLLTSNAFTPLDGGQPLRIIRQYCDEEIEVVVWEDNRNDCGGRHPTLMVFWSEECTDDPVPFDGTTKLNHLVGEVLYEMGIHISQSPLVAVLAKPNDQRFSVRELKILETLYLRMKREFLRRMEEEEKEAADEDYNSDYEKDELDASVDSLSECECSVCEEDQPSEESESSENSNDDDDDDDDDNNSSSEGRGLNDDDESDS